MGLLVNEHLTVVDAEFERRRSQTFPGMAHFANTGPSGKTCRECQHWGGGRASDYTSPTGRFHGLIKNHPCSRYESMMNGVTGPGVPADAQSCKHFSENPEPPARYRKAT